MNKHSPSNKQKRYLRKRQVAARYGDVHERSVDRWRHNGRIPQPIYLPGSRIPLWSEDALDENDRRAVLCCGGRSGVRNSDQA
jgi:hypothetical protein